MGKYVLKNVATGRVFEDSGWLLDDPCHGHSSQPSLIRAEYEQKAIRFGDRSEGIYRFSDWLPTCRCLTGSNAPVTYKSENLAKELGLENLYITLSGYMPEKGVVMTTCSFKETEAYSVCGRMDGEDSRILVVASAGNTARAFARVCSDNNIPLLLCVPEDNLKALWFSQPLNDCVKLVSVESGADYFDAIHLSNVAVKSDKFYAEGGAKNVARRDGMSTTMLSAVEVIGRIPDYYFQAVGSGTGAIAAWEANMRLLEDGRWGSHKCKLMVSQNTPFLPMYDAWQEDSRSLLDFDDEHARMQVEKIDAKVLSNRRPPYSIKGGLYDALKDTDGDVLRADNAAAREAAKMFEELEGVDINPAAAIALATLVDSVQKGRVEQDACIMLNITGAGEEKLKREADQIYYLEPSIVFAKHLPSDEEVITRIERLFE